VRPAGRTHLEVKVLYTPGKVSGYSVTWHRKPKLKIAPYSRQRFAEKIRQTLGGARGKSRRQVLDQLNPVLRGWVAYFQLTEARGGLDKFDGWIQRKLRALLWRQWQRGYSRAEPDARGPRSSARMAVCHQWAWSLVERRQFAPARSLPHVLVRPHGVDLAAGYTAALLVGFMNRPLRNRPAGGVGGRRRRLRLLPDSSVK
jgi:Group II intron, maturase-specific domain